MRHHLAGTLAAAFALGLAAPASATPLLHLGDLRRTNARLHGTVHDFTRNHGSDRRLYSPALGAKRDLYVYVPPGYDPCKKYPLMLWLHGFAQDETTLLDSVIGPLDRAIAAGHLPPMVVAAPDGSVQGTTCLFTAGSFFLNTRAGAYEDFLMRDVWDFLHANYSLRPEREAHVLAGASMGGGAAYGLAFKYPERFRPVIGIFPPLNARWLDCHGRYRANFDPDCWGWRTNYDRRLELVGRFYGVFPVRVNNVVSPLYGRASSAEILQEVSRENPIEMLDRLGIKDGVYDLFVGYGGKDDLNLDAQVESFLFVAKQRGLGVTVYYDPDGRHDVRTARKMFPAIVEWLGPKLAPYGPENR